VSWTPNGANSTLEQNIGTTIYYSQVATSGGSLFTICKFFKSDFRHPCTSPIIRTPQPEFNLSPTTKTIACGSTETVQFTVTNVYNSQTVNSYKWNIGSGWVLANTGTSISGTYTTTGNTLSLKPNPNGPYPPGNVSVTPKLNGVDQPTKTCIVTGTDISANGTITGVASLCANSSTYTLNNLEAGQTVTWSISDSNIASLSNTTGTTTTVNKTGDGPVTLSATVTNICGQSYIKNKDLYLGSPKPFTVAIGLAEEEYCDIKYHYRKYKINNYNPLLNYTTTVTGPSPKIRLSFLGRIYHSIS
jgi:hypothetical protein